MRAMQVKDVGEFRLIDLLAETIARDNDQCAQRLAGLGFRLRLTIGDDAAAWDCQAGTQVFTTDTMVEGVHFNLGQITWRELGWKSLAVNLSDVAAMGCEPAYSVVTLGLRGDLPVEGLLEMYRGMMEACHQCGGAVVGGDIVRSPVFFVTVGMVGIATSPAGLLTRHSASPGDRVAVTGHLGCSGGGLRMALEGASGRLDEATARHLREAHYRPVPRIPQGRALVQHGVVAAMDISDGLVDDLGKLCKASGVGAVIHAPKVPADDFLKRAFPDDWLKLALGGGEDYELLFTAPPEVMERVREALGVPVSVIGETVEGPPQVTVLDAHGRPITVEHGGWDHLRHQ